MSGGFIFDWTHTDLAGRIHVTEDSIHEDEDAAFRLSSCSPALQNFLRTHDSPPSPSIQVSFDLFIEEGNLVARNID
jgi:hypothetical protein